MFDICLAVVDVLLLNVVLRIGIGPISDKPYIFLILYACYVCGVIVEVPIVKFIYILAVHCLSEDFLQISIVYCCTMEIISELISESLVAWM